MKKYMLFSAIFFSFAASSQIVKPAAFAGTASNPTNAITSSTSDTMNLAVTGSYSSNTLTLTKRTGSTVTATAYLQSTYNGVDYANTDTVTVASGALKSYNVYKNFSAQSQPVSYRWVIVGGGSGSGTMDAYLVARRYF